MAQPSGEGMVEGRSGRPYATDVRDLDEDFDAFSGHRCSAERHRVRRQRDCSTVPP